MAVISRKMNKGNGWVTQGCYIFGGRFDLRMVVTKEKRRILREKEGNGGEQASKTVQLSLGQN